MKKPTPKPAKTPPGKPPIEPNPAKERRDRFERLKDVDL